LKPFSTALAFLVYSILSFSQNSVVEQNLRQAFDQPARVKWVRHYKGRIDDFNDIAVVLAFDGYFCKGQLLYLRSKEVFHLEGTLKGQLFQLKEIDSAGNESGFLAGTISGKAVEASWRNIDNSVGSQILMTETQSTDDFPVHCGDDKWVKIYAAKDGSSSIEMILQKGANNNLRGMIFTEGLSFKLKGEIDSQNHFLLDLKKGTGEVAGNLKGDFGNHRNFKASVSNENSEKKFTFKLKEQLSVACVEYADYTTNFDLTYPKAKNVAFNNWMKSATEWWVNACRNFAGKVKSGSPDPHSRASERAFGWCDLEFYSPNLISGFLNFSATWKPSFKGISFNFDLKNGREITWTDLFKEHFDRSFFINKVVKTAFKNHPLFSDTGFKKWIEQAEFSFFTIRKEGIVFSTDYNSLYGRQSLTVPFEELKPYLKSNSPVKFLIR